MADAIGAIAALVLAAPAANGTTTTTGVTTSASGSVFLVGVSYGANIGPNATTPVTDSKSNTYTRLGGVASTSTAIGAEWYYSSNASPAGGASHTFSIKIAATGGDVGIGVIEVTGLSQTTDQSGNALFAGHTTGGTVTSLTSPSMTTTNADDVAFVIGCDTGDATGTKTFTAATGGGTWTVATSNTNITFSPAAIGYQLLEATGSYSVTYNCGSSNGQVICGVQSMLASTGAAAQTPYQPWYQRAPILAM